MRIGILADIHEDVTRLAQALDVLRDKDVDELVVLGDIFEMGHDINATVDLLQQAGVAGVWGNHDLGFCHEPDQVLLGKYSDSVTGYMRTLTPRLEIGPFLFTHGLPHWDPTDPAEYYVGSRPDEEGVLTEIFATNHHDVIFVGHFHCWQIWNEQGALPWDSRSAMLLPSTQRHLVVVDAVMGGWCAIIDSVTRQLLPVRID